MALVIDGAVVAQMLRSPTGPVGRMLIERATRFQMAAKRQLAPHRKSGCLEDTITKRWEHIGGELAIRVVADSSPCSPTRQSYSLFVHEGTEPHTIYAKSPDKPLTFYWALGPRGAGVYSFAKVEHPGTAPIAFFRDNLPLLVA